MTELTERQKGIMDFIRKSMDENGYPPTLREICAKFDIKSTNGARYHLHRLHKLGKLVVEANKSRGMRPVDYAPSKRGKQRSYTLPILGSAPAGPLDYANPDLREDELTVDPNFFGERSAEPQLFGLRVKGDSMIDAGILNGDVVVVRPQPNARDGDIVVARLEDEATIKRFRRRAHEIVLEPANKAYKPIRIPNKGGQDFGQNFSVLGAVVGVIRSM